MDWLGCLAHIFNIHVDGFPKSFLVWYVPELETTDHRAFCNGNMKFFFFWWPCLSCLSFRFIVNNFTSTARRKINALDTSCFQDSPRQMQSYVVPMQPGQNVSTQQIQTTRRFRNQLQIQTVPSGLVCTKLGTQTIQLLLNWSSVCNHRLQDLWRSAAQRGQECTIQFVSRGDKFHSKEFQILGVIVIFVGWLHKQRCMRPLFT